MTLFQKLQSNDAFVPAFSPELDIVVFAPKASSVTEISGRSRQIFGQAADCGLHLALAELPVEFFQALDARIPRDRKTLTSLRSVLMKPEHLDWVDRIWALLLAAAAKDAKAEADPI